jgi:hypothetical protein
MKRANIKSGANAWRTNFKTIGVSTFFLIALELGSITNTYAQRGERLFLGILGNIGHAGRFLHEGRAFPFWHFSVLPRLGANFLFLPPLSMRFMMGGLEFFFYNGIYYRNINGQYSVVPAPIGFRASVLPKDCFQFYMGKIPYYYYYGAYYTLINGKYEVVPAPVGAEVPGIPEGYKKIEAEGQTCYLFNGVKYKQIISDGQTWYQVIENTQNSNVAPSSTLPK